MFRIRAYDELIKELEYINEQLDIVKSDKSLNQVHKFNDLKVLMLIKVEIIKAINQVIKTK